MKGKLKKILFGAIIFCLTLGIKPSESAKAAEVGEHKHTSACYGEDTYRLYKATDQYGLVTYSYSREPYNSYGQNVYCPFCGEYVFNVGQYSSVTSKACSKCHALVELAGTRRYLFCQESGVEKIDDNTYWLTIPSWGWPTFKGSPVRFQTSYTDFMEIKLDQTYDLFLHSQRAHSYSGTPDWLEISKPGGGTTCYKSSCTPVLTYTVTGAELLEGMNKPAPDPTWYDQCDCHPSFLIKMDNKWECAWGNTINKIEYRCPGCSKVYFTEYLDKYSSGSFYSRYSSYLINYPKIKYADGTIEWGRREFMQYYDDTDNRNEEEHSIYDNEHRVAFAKKPSNYSSSDDPYFQTEPYKAYKAANDMSYKYYWIWGVDNPTIRGFKIVSISEMKALMNQYIPACVRSTENKPVGGSATEVPHETSGQCGDNVFWSYDEETKKLSITGSGAMWELGNIGTQVKLKLLDVCDCGCDYLAPEYSYIHDIGIQYSIYDRKYICPACGKIYAKYSRENGMDPMNNSTNYSNYSLTVYYVNGVKPDGTKSVASKEYYSRDYGGNCNSNCNSVVISQLDSVYYKAPNNIKDESGNYLIHLAERCNSKELIAKELEESYGFSSDLPYVTVGGSVAPWSWLKGSIDTIEIGENITHLANGAFANLGFTTLNYNAKVCEWNNISYSDNSNYHVGTFGYLETSSIKTINIGPNVKCLYANSFSYLDKLEKVNWYATNCTYADSAFESTGRSVDSGGFTVSFPNTVDVIPAYTFYNSNLSGDLDTSKIKNIKRVAFGNTALKTVTIDGITETVDTNAFSHIKTLNRINFNNNVTADDYGCIFHSSRNETGGTCLLRIGPRVTKIQKKFFAYAGITKVEFTGTPSLSYIDVDAFYNCGALSEITIPKTVTAFGSGPIFEGCTKLTTINWNAEKCTKSSSYLFKDLPNLSSFIIGQSVKELPTRICFSCPNLKSLIIPEGVTVINSSAFILSGITDVVFPKSLCKLGYNVINNAEGKLNSVTIQSNIYMTTGDFGSVNIGKLTFTGNATKAAVNSFAFSKIDHLVLGTVRYVEAGAFTKAEIKKCEGIENLKRIGKESLDIVSEDPITFGPDLEVLDYKAFIRCNASKITWNSPNVLLYNSIVYEVEDPDPAASVLNPSLKSQNSPFAKFPKLKEVVFKTSTIPDYLFNKCGTIETIDFQVPVTEIGKCALGTTKISKLPDTTALTEIGDYAFYNCTNLTKVELGSKEQKVNTVLQNVGPGAFEGCTSLNELWNFSKTAEFTAPFGESNLDNLKIYSYSTSSLNQFASVPTKLTILDYPWKNGCVNAGIQGGGLNDPSADIHAVVLQNPIKVVPSKYKRLPSGEEFATVAFSDLIEVKGYDYFGDAVTVLCNATNWAELSRPNAGTVYVVKDDSWTKWETKTTEAELQTNSKYKLVFNNGEMSMFDEFYLAGVEPIGGSVALQSFDSSGRQVPVIALESNDSYLVSGNAIPQIKVNPTVMTEVPESYKLTIQSRKQDADTGEFISKSDSLSSETDTDLNEQLKAYNWDIRGDLYSEEFKLTLKVNDIECGKWILKFDSPLISSVTLNDTDEIIASLVSAKDEKTGVVAKELIAGYSEHHSITFKQANQINAHTAIDQIKVSLVDSITGEIYVSQLLDNLDVTGSDSNNSDLKYYTWEFELPPTVAEGTKLNLKMESDGVFYEGATRPAPSDCYNSQTAQSLSQVFTVTNPLVSYEVLSYEATPQIYEIEVGSELPRNAFSVTRTVKLGSQTKVQPVVDWECNYSSSHTVNRNSLDQIVARDYLLTIGSDSVPVQILIKPREIICPDCLNSYESNDDGSDPLCSNCKNPVSVSAVNEVTEVVKGTDVPKVAVRIEFVDGSQKITNTGYVVTDYDKNVIGSQVITITLPGTGISTVAPIVVVDTVQSDSINQQNLTTNSVGSSLSTAHLTESSYTDELLDKLYKDSVVNFTPGAYITITVEVNGQTYVVGKQIK